MFATERKEIESIGKQKVELVNSFKAMKETFEKEDDKTPDAIKLKTLQMLIQDQKRWKMRWENLLRN